MDRQEFRGWVPNTSGALSFSVFGESSEPTYSIYSNKADKKIRYVLSVQKRGLSDSAIPKKLSEFFFKLDGTFFFVCVAEGPGEVPFQKGAMKGHIFIYKKEHWHNCGFNEFDKYSTILDDYSHECHGELRDYFSSVYEEATRKLATYAYSVVEFNLNRNGITEIIFSSPYVFNCLGENQKITKNAAIQEFTESYKISSQSFNFLKDISHHHQNHSPKTDTLVRLHPLENDISWRALTLRELYKKVIEFKRGGNNCIYFSALGIIPYIKCFKLICETEKVEDENLPVINTEFLKESLAASHKKHLVSESEDLSLKSFFQGTLFGFIAIYLSVSGILSVLPDDKKKDLNISGPLVVASKYAIEHPFPCLFFILSLISTYFFINVAKRSHKISFLLKAYRDFQRILLCYNKHLNAAIQGGLGILCLSIYALIFWLCTTHPSIF